jgi:hypothetical protein
LAVLRRAFRAFGLGVDNAARVVGVTAQEVHCRKTEQAEALVTLESLERDGLRVQPMNLLAHLVGLVLEPGDLLLVRLDQLVLFCQCANDE